MATQKGRTWASGHEEVNKETSLGNCPNHTPTNKNPLRPCTDFQLMDMKLHICIYPKLKFCEKPNSRGSSASPIHIRVEPLSIVALRKVRCGQWKLPPIVLHNKRGAPTTVPPSIIREMHHRFDLHHTPSIHCQVTHFKPKDLNHWYLSSTLPVNGVPRIVNSIATA